MSKAQMTMQAKDGVDVIFELSSGTIIARVSQEDNTLTLIADTRLAMLIAPETESRLVITGLIWDPAESEGD